MKKTIYAFVMGCAVVINATGQDAPSAEKKEGKLTINGYIDSYYLTAANRPGPGHLMGLGAGRAFDRLTDQFALGLAQTRFAYTTDKSEMVIDLTFGPNAQLGNFGNAPLGYLPSDSYKKALYGTGASIKQAYFTYKFTEKLSFTVGQFGTHVGYEVIDAPVNFHYSLSNLFNNGPFYHVGAKVNYAISDKLGVMAGVVNNWDAMIDWKSNKSLVAQLYASPIEGLNIYLNAIGGANDDGYFVSRTRKEPSPNYASTTPYTRAMLDLTSGYQVTEKFYLGLNAAFGMYFYNTKDLGLPNDNLTFPDGSEGQSASWFGVAVYPNYKINDMLSIGVRLEHFNDSKGVRYFGYVYGLDTDGDGTGDYTGSVAASNNSATFTAPITLADGHVIIKPEVRIDVASSYIKPVGGEKVEFNYYENFDGKAKYDVAEGKYKGGTPVQMTVGTAFIYKF